MVTDPVCGITFDPKDAAATREHAGVTLYFYSQACVERYDDDPHYYGHPDEHPHYETPHEHRDEA